MEINIRWKDGALDDLTAIAQWHYNGGRLRTAEKLVTNILHSIDLLQTNPYMGAVDDLLSDTVSCYRSFVTHPYYKTIYSVDQANQLVHIIAIWDCRQNMASIKDILNR